jgi:anti-sigma B factor antagonist
MKVSARQRDGVTILDLKGKFTIGSGDVAIREAIQQSVQEGKIKILLNASEITTIDSSGIGELVAGFTSVTNRGGQLKLYKLPPKLEDILQVTQLITVFEVFEDEDEAVRSF